MPNNNNYNYNCNCNYNNSAPRRPQILRAYVARNNFAGTNRVILADASSSMVDNNSQCYETFVAVAETAKQLHSKAPTPGWEYASLPRKLGGLCPLSLKGMKFHIYDDTEDDGTDDDDDDKHEHDDDDEHDNFYIWEVGCIYDTRAVGTKQVESFVKHVVMATKQFRDHDRDWKDGGNYAAQHRFSPTLRAMIPEVDHYVRLDELQTEVDTLRDIMEENIRKLLDRGDRLEPLLAKSGELKEAAFVFKTNANKLKRIMRRKYYWQIARRGLAAGTAVTSLALAITLPLVLV